RRRLCGEDAWKRFAAASPTLPFAGPGPVDWKGIGWKPVLLGLALYGCLMLTHEWIIGIQPYP
ncbi:MAG: NnrU protein, partial [Alphaproteobacteria bacterium]|nr:NnrU protein [Alphaproteobacteria bacterium]